MTDYVRPNPSKYTDKDALATGTAEKVIVGSDFDSEFNDISTAVNSKFDADDENIANGIAGLDANAKVPDAQLYTATTTQIGVLETATAAEGQALTATDKIVTPGIFAATALAWGDAGGAGMVGDIARLTDPAVDGLLGWDTTGNAVLNFTLGAGLVRSGSAMTVNHDAATNFVAAEHISHSAVSITAGAGLTGGGTLEATRDIAVGAGDGIAVAADAVAVDISGLTAATATDITGTDGYLFDDGGTMKRIAHQSGGLPIISTALTTFTPTSAQCNSYFRMTASTPITFAVNTGVGVVGNVMIIERTTSAGTVTIGGTATILSPFSSDACRTQYSVICLVCVGTNTWTLYGDAV